MISDDLKLQLIGITTRAELNECYDILKHVSHTLTQNEKSAFTAGDEVYWHSTKKGGKRIDGVITKVMKKNVKIRVGYEEWKVHPSFLRHAHDEITKDDVKKLNDAISEAVMNNWSANNESKTFNVLTGEFE